MVRKYIDLNKIESRGAYLNIISSPRGPGKSWALKNRVIERWLHKGEMFIYVRRTSEEIDLTKSSHFDDILLQKYEGKYSVKVKGDKFFFKDNSVEDAEWELFGYAIPVSKQQSYKSSAFPLVTTIYYDEFIPDNPWSRQNPQEVHQFFSLIETVARDRKNLKVFMLSNTGFAQNPYFRFFNIKSSDFMNQEFIKRNSGAVCMWYFRYEEEEKEMAEQKLSSLISGESFRKASVSGDFKDISSSLVASRPENAVPWLLLDASHGKFFRIFQHEKGFWVDAGKSIAGLKTFTMGRWEISETSEYSPKVIEKLKHVLSERVITFADPDVKAEFITKLRKSNRN